MVASAVLLELLGVIVATTGEVLSFVAVERVRYRWLIARISKDQRRMIYARGRLEHEWWRLGKQTAILAFATYAFLEGPPPPFTTEMFVGRTLIMALSVAMSINTIREWVWHKRLMMQPGSEDDV